MATATRVLAEDGGAGASGSSRSRGPGRFLLRGLVQLADAVSNSHAIISLSGRRGGPAPPHPARKHQPPFSPPRNRYPATETGSKGWPPLTTLSGQRNLTLHRSPRGGAVAQRLRGRPATTPAERDVLPLCPLPAQGQAAASPPQGAILGGIQRFCASIWAGYGRGNYHGCPYTATCRCSERYLAPAAVRLAASSGV